MSNKNIQIPFVDLKIPDINSPEYASGLQGVFDNIEDNFKVLANHEFIKGDAGNSIEIIEYPFFNDDDSYTDIGIQLINYIEKRFSDQGAIEINGKQYDVLSYFNRWLALTDEERDGLNIPSIKMICHVNGIDNTKTPVSSLYYVFFDGRYINSELGFDEKIYQNISDTSCVLIWNKDTGFEALDNTFPKITYEDGVGLCWQINGISTGMPIRGKAGKDGRNSSISIVTVQNNNISNDGSKYKDTVDEVYNYNRGYVKVDDIDINEYDKTSSLIILKDGENSFFYFGQLSVEKTESDIDVLYAYYDTSYSLNHTMNIQSVIDAFKNIDIHNSGEDSTTGFRGLFIPMQRTAEDGTQKAHLISSSNYSNDYKSLKSNLSIAPINDINSLEVIDDNGNTQFGIERNLYLKLNKDSNVFNNCETTIDIIKYRLKQVIRLVNLNTDNPFFESYSDNRLGSRFYGTIGDNFTQLSKDNTCFKFLDENTQTYKTSSDHFVSMPEDAARQLTTTGLYRWEAVDTEGIDKRFKVIYTTTLTPGADTRFIWFNGSSLDDSDGVNSIKDEDKVAPYIIPGWSESEMFTFERFEPLFINQYSGDTSTLDINYNVSVSGTKNDPYKNLAVTGSVSAKDLNVSENISAKRFKNIVTDDTIIANNGISIGANDEDGRKCEISADGDIQCNNGSFNSIDAVNVNIDYLNTESSSMRNVLISPTDSSSVRIEKSSINSNAVDIDAVNANKITIYGTDDNVIESVSNVPVITSNISTHFNDNSNIVLSNQASDSSQIYLKNTLTDKAGNGVSENQIIDNTSFESAKNFNMHRLSVDTSGTEFTTLKNENPCTNNSLKTYKETHSVGKNGEFVNELNFNKSFIDTNNPLLKASIARGTKLNASDGISVLINSDFIFKVNIRSRCDNGYRACLNSNSYVNLILMYKIGNDSFKAGTAKYKFNTMKQYGNATLNNLDDNGYEWVGYDENNNEIASKVYKETDRYYTYVIKPSSFNIESGSEFYKNIVNNVNNNDIEFIVVPEIYIKAHSQQRKENKDGKKLISKISVTNFIPIVRSGSQNTLISKINSKVDYSDTPGYLVYYSKKSKSGSTVKATTLCNDGLVMRAGKYVFGLGYAENIIDHEKSNYNKIVNSAHWDGTRKSDVPVLFYHEYDERMYTDNNTPRNVLTTSEGYASRMNAIPLEDIFKCIKFLRLKFSNEFDSIEL